MNRSEAIPERIIRFKAVKLLDRYRQLLLFVATGALNTLFGYGTYAAFIFVGLAPSLALFLATILSIGFNFVTFGSVVFNRMDGKILGRFLLVYICNYFGNAYALNILRAENFSPYIAQLAIMPFSVLFLFVVMKYFVFINRT